MAENQQILFIDDDVGLRDEMLVLFPNYRIRVCDRIGAALELSTQQVFSAYVLNLSLPDGSGFGLCQKIRAFDSNTPMIVISIHDSESYRKHAQEVGAHGFWTKSEDLNRLKHMVENCIYESRVRSFEAKRAEFEAIREERNSSAARRSCARPRCDK
jgi:DNA-binding NtrC family response regulator